MSLFDPQKPASPGAALAIELLLAGVELLRQPGPAAQLQVFDSPWYSDVVQQLARDLSFEGPSPTAAANVFIWRALEAVVTNTTAPSPVASVEQAELMASESLEIAELACCVLKSKVDTRGLPAMMRLSQTIGREWSAFTQLTAAGACTGDYAGMSVLGRFLLMAAAERLLDAAIEEHVAVEPADESSERGSGQQESA